MSECNIFYELDDSAWEAVVRRVDSAPVAAIVMHIDRSAQTALTSAEANAEAAELELEAQLAWRRDQKIDG